MSLSLYMRNTSTINKFHHETLDIHEQMIKNLYENTLVVDVVIMIN